MNTSDALPRLRVPGGPVLARPIVPAGTVKLDDPALSVMTDFLQTIPISVDGETPIDEALQHMQAIECMDRTCSRREIRVQDIMTPVASWEVLDDRTVCRATVAHVVATFKATGHRHLLVVERAAQPAQCIVRGLFSASRLERELGLSIDVCVASSFADIEKVLAHPYGECG